MKPSVHVSHLKGHALKIKINFKKMIKLKIFYLNIIKYMDIRLNYFQNILTRKDNQLKCFYLSCQGNLYMYHYDSNFYNAMGILYKNNNNNLSLE